MDWIIELLKFWGVPTAFFGLFIWLLQRSISKRDKKAEEREKNREKLDVVLLQSTSAAIALGEATAKAVQKIPDAHCNGDMHAALNYAAQIKHNQKDFLTSIGVHSLHED